MFENEDEPIYLYVGNHCRLESIQDHIDLIHEIFKNHEINFVISHEVMPDRINLIIDEFSSKNEIVKLERIKDQYPKTVYIVFLTEFVTKRGGLLSFNHFGGIVDTCLIGGHNLYDSILNRKIRISPKEFLISLLWLPVLFFYGGLFGLWSSTCWLCNIMLGRSTPHPAAQFHNKHHRVFGFHARFLGIEEAIKLADGLLAMHVSIFNQLQLCKFWKNYSFKTYGVMYIELNISRIISELRKPSVLCMEVTGSVTKYRRSWIARVNKDILASKIPGFRFCKVRSFGEFGSNLEFGRNAYSLHPPQQATWIFASPVRLYRSLMIDCNVPLITTNFHQHPIENICIKYDGVNTLKFLSDINSNVENKIKMMLPRLQDYEEFSSGMNDAIITKILQCKKN